MSVHGYKNIDRFEKFFFLDKAPIAIDKNTIKSEKQIQEYDSKRNSSLPALLQMSGDILKCDKTSSLQAPFKVGTHK